MARQWMLSICLIGLVTAPLSAQTPQFRWRSGQLMNYRVAQMTNADETIGDKTLATSTKLDLVKRWQVMDVDAAGTATLQMTLVSLRMETKPPTGDPIIFDSANPAQSHEQLREEMGKYVGPALTIVRIDNRGQIVEVKESKFGPASRLQCDLPFKLTLPTAPLAANQSWERSYQIKMDPPQGAGEVYEAGQTYTCKGVAKNLATIHMTTTVKNAPESASDKLPLLPLMPEGDIHFDIATGVLQAVRYQFGQELAGHRGDGSKYQFKSRYSEDLIEVAKP